MSMLFKRIKDWATSITAFRSGDVIPVDGPSGTAKMSKDDLLQEAAENTAASGLVATPEQVDNKIANALIYEFRDTEEITEVDATQDSSSVSGNKVYYNSTYHLAALQDSAYQQVHCFPVEEGKVYRVKNGYGQSDRQTNPYGVVCTSKLPSVSGTTQYAQVIAGKGTGSAAKDTFTFKASINGYLYANCHVDEQHFSVWECEEITTNEKLTEVSEQTAEIPSLEQALENEIVRSEGQDYLPNWIDGDTMILFRKDSGVKVIYNATYTLSQEQALSSTDVYVFNLTAGRYRASNMRGSSVQVNPLMVASTYSDISTSQARRYVQFLNGSSESVVNVSNVEFELLQDAYVYINCSSNRTCTLVKLKQESVKEVVQRLEGVENVNHWKGKKIVWMGTSVPYGSGATTSYVKIIEEALQFNLIPAVIPGEALHAQYDSDSGLWYPLTYGSTCLSKLEYATAKNAGLTNITIQDAPITPWVPGGDWQHYNNYYRAYDNVLTAENADADLWVLDVVPNNTNFALDDFNAFDFTNWKYSDNSSFASHRGTFLGALLFLINEIYTLNANARILLFLGSAFAYSDGKSNFEKLTVKGVELVDIWGDVNLLKPSLAVIKQQGGSDNHPSTFGHEVLGKRLIGRMLSVS